MKRFVASLLSLQIAFLSPAGWSEGLLDYGGGPSGVASPGSANLPQAGAARGIPYLLDCEDVLTIGGTGSYEKHFVKGADNEMRMAQLLFDYQVIFTSLSQDALILGLPKYISALKVLQQKTNEFDDLPRQADQMKKAIVEMSQLAQNPAALKELAWEILEYQVTLASERTNNMHLNEIRHLQLSRLRENLMQGERKELFEAVMSEYIREHLIVTVDMAAKRFATRLAGHGESLDKKYKKGLLIGIAGVVLAANFITFDFNNWHCGEWANTYFGTRCRTPGYNPQFGLVKALMSTVPTGFFTFLIGGHAWRAKLRDNERNFILSLTTQSQRDYSVSNNLGSFQGRTAVIFSRYEEMFSKGILSVEQACKEDVCSLTPNQIAYIGHIDLLELQRLQISIRDTFREKPINDQIQLIRDLAKSVVAKPESYKSQMTLRRQIDLFTKELRAVRDLRTEVFEELTRKTQTLIGAMKMLRDKPYSSEPGTMSDDDIAKNQLLLGKLNTDLASLDRIPVDAKAFEARIRKAKAAAEKMEGFLGEMPKTPEAWKSLAEELLLEMDRIGK